MEKRRKALPKHAAKREFEQSFGRPVGVLDARLRIQNDDCRSQIVEPGVGAAAERIERFGGPVGRVLGRFTHEVTRRGHRSVCLARLSWLTGLAPSLKTGELGLDGID